FQRYALRGKPLAKEAACGKVCAFPHEPVFNINDLRLPRASRMNSGSASRPLIISYLPQLQDICPKYRGKTGVVLLQKRGFAHLLIATCYFFAEVGQRSCSFPCISV